MEEGASSRRKEHEGCAPKRPYNGVGAWKRAHLRAGKNMKDALRDIVHDVALKQ